jgi:hypothetical protein
MRVPESFFLRAYSAATHLYPDQFRWRYHAQMLDAVHHTYEESTTLGDDLHLAMSLVGDTLRGVLHEHARTASPKRPGYIVAFVVLFSFLQLTAAVSYQQYLRYAINCHPTMTVNKIVAEVASAPLTACQTLHGSRSEMATPDWLRGDDSFTALYDAAGQPVMSDITLHGALPRPPAGIFEYMRTHQIDRVTWQPEQGIRVALVGQRLPNGGFVLSGQSLLESENREARFHNLMLVIWIFMVATAVTLVLRIRLRSQTA